VPGPSFPKLFLFTAANSFTKNEEPGISFQSQCPLESQLQHDMLPLLCFYRRLPPKFILILITLLLPAGKQQALKQAAPSCWSKSLTTTGVSHHDKLVGHGQEKENQIQHIKPTLGGQQLLS